MKDWIKTIISVSVGIIMALVGGYVALALSSVHREMDRMDRDITQIQIERRADKAEHKADIVAIHRRISELHGQ